MKTKILIALLTIGLFNYATADAQVKKHQQQKEQTHKMEMMYSCPMHPEIKGKKPGVCPTCGMDLKKMEMQQDSMKMNMMKRTQTFSCPMHPNQVSEKPGKCPECGMEFKKMKQAKMKAYFCPMHPELQSDKPGKCSECGMEFKKMEMRKEMKMEKKKEHLNKNSKQ